MEGHLEALAETRGDAGLHAQERDAPVMDVVREPLGSAGDRCDGGAGGALGCAAAGAGDEEVQPEFTEFEEWICVGCSNLELRVASSRSRGDRSGGQRHCHQQRRQPQRHES